MEGQLIEHPLAELIRDAVNAGLSGALRLARERVKAAVYFEDGGLVFATSNLRAHRLVESLKRNGLLTDSQFTDLPSTATDDQLAVALVKRQLITPETLRKIRGQQVSDVLRLALLWTDGGWEFDSRVRLTDGLRVPVDVNQLLLDCARRLPENFVASRLNGSEGTYSRTQTKGRGTKFLPSEALILSRAETPLKLSKLVADSGFPEEETLRAVYALLLSGFLRHSNWNAVLTSEVSKHSTSIHRSKPTVSPRSATRSQPMANEPTDLESDLEALFERLKRATDHYEVLNLGRRAEAEEIKNVYHTLARRFHPDRFHKSEPELRSRVDSAFARIAQAYETLSDQSLRAAYDAKLAFDSKLASPTLGANRPAPSSTGKEAPAAELSSAESNFQRGVAALAQNKLDDAIHLLAEAARLEPREARYRAHYGQALTRLKRAQRFAEAELQTAMSLEPDNVSWRVMLAEFYKELGFRLRACGELERALAIDPKNAAARELLSGLKTEG